MEIVFSDYYKELFTGSIHVAEKHSKEILENPYRKTVIENDKLKLCFLLSELINDKFYTLISTSEEKERIVVREVYKIKKEFLDEQDINDPYLILQKLIWEFGLTIRVGNQLSKFVYKEEILVANSTDQATDFLQFINPQNHSFLVGSFLKLINKDGQNFLSCFLAYGIDMDKYRAWWSDRIESDNNASEVFKSKLLQCNPGRQDWEKYEDICIEIIEYLFKDSFRTFTSKIQSRTSDNLEIRDLIVVNDVKENISFWNDIKNEFKSKHIIFEFKNLVETIGKDEVNQVDDYTNKAIGKFAIILSRKGISEPGASAVKRKYNENGVLILNINDKELIEMLDRKGKGEDPMEILRNKKTEFELSF